MPRANARNAMFNRSRRNLARWFTLSMGSILVVFSGAIYYQEANKNLERLDQLLYKKARVMAANVEYELYQGQSRAILDSVPLLGNNPPPPDSEIIYARWYDRSGQLKQFFGAAAPEQLNETWEFETIKTADNYIGAKPTVTAVCSPMSYRSGLCSGSINAAATQTRANVALPQSFPIRYIWLRQVTLPVMHNGKAIGYLQIAMPMTRVQESLRNFLLILILTVLIALGATSLAGWFLGGLAMRPILEAYEQLQRFTANASHELRAPLAAILSNAQVGLLAPIDDGAAQHLRLEKIADVAKSMNILIGNLLFLARKTGCLAPEYLKEIDLTDLLAELVDCQTTTTAAQHLDFKSDLPFEPIMVQAEPDLLRQAVGNLIGNACKYTPAGGMVQLRLFTSSHQAIIQVEDNGIGIPQEDLPHIFERFYRVDKERVRETGGFGLGLAIAQQIIAAHGGHLSVQSEVGQGSIFQIELPLQY
ncbi:sensor histidine kinase [Microseira wollei]|nr:ATP-binding protein [Microseira wollei]